MCYSSWKPELVIRQSKFKANHFGSLHFVGLPKMFQNTDFMPVSEGTCGWVFGEKQEGYSHSGLLDQNG
jgi:hypothetical protein